MSLGGLHDEVKYAATGKLISGHAGRIVQSLKKAQTSNPVFVLDEIDNVGTDFRGDPSSALLEVLDLNRIIHSTINSGTGIRSFKGIVHCHR
jgi:ATP-dependent Lon protease